MTHELNVLAVVRDADRYVFLYDADNTDVLLRLFDEFAMDGNLNFTQDDALNLGRLARRKRDEAASPT